MPLFERGYEKDPAGVALEAQRQAKKDGIDVVLVDTAGRMQDNKPLMEALSKLIDVNRPDLCLFVGEALVGNDAVDQLKKFNQSLADMSSLVISLTPTLTLYFSVGPIHHASSALRSLDTVAYTARSAWRCTPAAVNLISACCLRLRLREALSGGWCGPHRRCRDSSTAWF